MESTSVDFAIAPVERAELQDDAIGGAANLLGMMVTLVGCEMACGVFADEYASDKPPLILHDPATISILTDDEAC